MKTEPSSGEFYRYKNTNFKIEDIADDDTRSYGINPEISDERRPFTGTEEAEQVHENRLLGSKRNFEESPLEESRISPSAEEETAMDDAVLQILMTDPPTWTEDVDQTTSDPTADQNQWGNDQHTRPEPTDEVERTIRAEREPSAWRRQETQSESNSLQDLINKETISKTISYSDRESRDGKMTSQNVVDEETGIDRPETDTETEVNDGDARAEALQQNTGPSYHKTEEHERDYETSSAMLPHPSGLAAGQLRQRDETETPTQSPVRPAVKELDTTQDATRDISHPEEPSSDSDITVMDVNLSPSPTLIDNGCETSPMESKSSATSPTIAKTSEEEEVAEETAPTGTLSALVLEGIETNSSEGNPQVDLEPEDVVDGRITGLNDRWQRNGVQSSETADRNEEETNDSLLDEEIALQEGLLEVASTDESSAEEPFNLKSRLNRSGEFITDADRVSIPDDAASQIQNWSDENRLIAANGNLEPNIGPKNTTKESFDQYSPASPAGIESLPSTPFQAGSEFELNSAKTDQTSGQEGNENFQSDVLRADELTETGAKADDQNASLKGFSSAGEGRAAESISRRRFEFVNAEAEPTVDDELHPERIAAEDAVSDHSIQDVYRSGQSFRSSLVDEVFEGFIPAEVSRQPHALTDVLRDTEEVFGPRSSASGPPTLHDHSIVGDDEVWLTSAQPILEDVLEKDKDDVFTGSPKRVSVSTSEADNQLRLAFESDRSLEDGSAPISLKEESELSDPDLTVQSGTVENAEQLFGHYLVENDPRTQLVPDQSYERPANYNESIEASKPAHLTSQWASEDVSSAESLDVKHHFHHPKFEHGSTPAEAARAELDAGQVALAPITGGKIHLHLFDSICD